MSKSITVQYYAILREQRGCSEETLETDAATPGELYSALSNQYTFTLRPDQLKVAVNAEFDTMDAALKDGDTVVFVPPVAGG